MILLSISDALQISNQVHTAHLIVTMAMAMAMAITMMAMHR